MEPAEPPQRRFALRAGIAGLLAVLAGAGLAVAPVTVSDTVVSWPKEGAGSTVLLLTNQTPYRLDLAFDSSAAQAAQGGTLFATMNPGRDDAKKLGLVMTVAGDTLTIASGGSTKDVRVPAGASFALHSDVHGMTLSRDGRSVVSWPSVLPPEVDALITTVQDPSLTAKLQVVDDFNTTPTPVKVGLMILLWLALAAALVLLWLDEKDSRERWKAIAAPEARPWWRRFVITDAVVILALVGWVFIGPMTDDDGYYANMALNYGDGGYVGNYYQMFNQSFTPFTWLWQAFYFWQELGGRSPVWLRLPALAAAVIAWFLTRHFLDRMMGERTLWFRRAAHLFLGLVYVAWWLPYAIGTRPEILGALGSAIALVLVARSIERRSLLPAAFGAMAAGLAFAAHPTGGVAFAPIVVAIPALWRIARRNGTVLSALARTVGVLSVGSVPLFAAFADASLHDFLVGSARFRAVETPLDWTSEYARYDLLLSNSPMGAYAKRAVVLVALVALLWFALLWVATRIRKTPLSVRMTLAGWSLAIALVALWITTSKWTHHFGALAVIGPVLLTTVFFLTPRVVREVLGDRRLPVWLLVLVPLSFVPPIVVSLEGPNSWAYAWAQFMYRAWVPPQVGSLTLAGLQIWVPVLVLCIVGVALLLRRRGRDWRGAGGLFAATALLSIFFLLSTGFLYATFANAAVRGLASYSVGAANLKDPSGKACLTENAITLWDAASGTALPAASGVANVAPAAAPIAQSPAPEMIDPAALPVGGWPSSDPPPAGNLTIWADAADGLSAARQTGWYQLPATLSPSQRVSFLVGGTVTDDNATGVVAQVGSRSGDRVTVDREVWLTDAAERPGWRTLTVDLGAKDLGPDAVIRLIGIDGSSAAGHWFGFSAPQLADGVRMSDYVRHGEPSLVAWQSSFWFPCERPVRIADGIIEPPAVATTWGNVSPDNIWVDRRGGALAGAARIATVSTPATEMIEAGSLWGRVETFQYPYPTNGYTLTSTPRTAMGWSSPFGDASQLVDAKRTGALP